MRILRLLKHDNVLNMKAAWSDKENYYMLFDYAVNGDLSKFLEKYGPLSPEMT